jgi:accessory gene regulator B
VTKFAESGISYLINLGCVSESDRDIYEYGFVLLSSLIVNLLIAVAIGFTFGMPLAMLTMLISLIALRTVSGGYHAESFGMCVAVSAASLAIAIAVIRFTPQSARHFIAAALSVFAIAVVFARAPVSHRNRPLDATEIIKFRKLSRITVVVAVFLSLLLFLMCASLYGFSIAVGIALSGTATLLAALKKQGDEHDDEKV